MVGEDKLTLCGRVSLQEPTKGLSGVVIFAHAEQDRTRHGLQMRVVHGEHRARPKDPGTQQGALISFNIHSSPPPYGKPSFPILSTHSLLLESLTQSAQLKELCLLAMVRPLVPIPSFSYGFSPLRLTRTLNLPGCLSGKF